MKPKRHSKYSQTSTAFTKKKLAEMLTSKVGNIGTQHMVLSKKALKVYEKAGLI